MIELKDQMNFTVRLEDFPERIVSLVPSQTELLFDIGLEEKVVGITKFCIHPKEWYQTKPRVGGTKTVHFDKIHELQPDLIIANKEENTKEVIETLQRDYPVYISDITNVDEALEMILDIGYITNKKKESEIICSKVIEDMKDLPVFKGKIIYLMWYDPFMAASSGTFIGNVIDKLGFQNVLPEDFPRYGEIDTELIKELDPDYLLLSSEPFPFKEKHLRELENQTGINCVLVDGEMFSWYGSRMMKMKDYFEQLQQVFVL